MMLLMDTVTSPSRTFVSQLVIWFSAPVEDLRSFKAVLVLDVFITQCELLVQ